MTVHCFELCGNPIETLPPYPPFWTGGGGVQPPDPTVPYIFCPTAPSTAVAGSADAPVTITGQNIPCPVTVKVNGGAAITPTACSATSITFDMPHSTAVAGTVTIQVYDGSGAAIPTPCTFTYTAAAVMTVVCPLAPATAIVGTPGVVVSVNGTLFTATCEVLWDGVAQATTQISQTQLRFTAPAAPAGIYTISVRETATGFIAATTCPFEWTVVLVPPVVTAVVPDYIGNWDPPKLVTVTGTGFDATTFITMNLTQYTTTLVSPTTVTFMTTDAISNATLTLRAHNGTLQNASNPVIFMCVENPTLSMISPTTMSITDPVTPLYVLGSGYGNTAKILLDGVIQPTTIFHGGQVTCNITPSLYTAGQVVQVTVQLGHDPAHVDNVLPVTNPNTLPPNGPLTLPLTFTA